MGSCFSVPEAGPHQQPGPRRSKNAVVPLAQAAPSSGSQPQSQQVTANQGSRISDATVVRDQARDQGSQHLAAHPSLQSLVKACLVVQPANLHQHASHLSTATSAALKDIHQSPVPASASWTSALGATTASVRDCLDRVFAPIVQDVEEQLGNPNGSSSWDTVRPEQLIYLMSAGAQSHYAKYASSSPGAAAWLGSAVKPLAELLHQCYAHPACSQWQHASPGIPALDALMSMIGVILTRNVLLETQASLEARAGVLQQLLDLVGWTPGLLSACCSPPSRSLAVAVQTPVQHQQGERRVKLVIRRTAAFWDALSQVQAQHIPGAVGRDTSEVQPVSQGLTCKLFPSFVDEWAADGEEDGDGVTRVLEAGEGHGPRKEFFVLAAANAAGLDIPAVTGQQGEGTVLISTANDRPSLGTRALGGATHGGGGQPRPQLLVFNRTAGMFWYNTGLSKSDHLSKAYHFLGWLLGQSLMNYAPPGLALPPVMMSHLLTGISHYRPKLSHLQHLDPTLASNITKASQLPLDDFTAMLELESLPTSLTREQYIEHAVQRLLVDEVTWQAEAMSAGLLTVIDPDVCGRWCLGPAELSAALGPEEGATGPAASGSLQLRKVFRVVMDAELSVGGNGQVVGELLWEVLDSWPRDKQLQFVEFVTGTQRLPLPGSELLKIECPFVAMGVLEHKTLLFTLPQAHTCANLLELPDYWTCLLHVRGHAADPLTASQQADLRREIKHILQDRLTVALTGCKSYGLDDRDA